MPRRAALAIALGLLAGSASVAAAFDDAPGEDLPWPFGRYSRSDLHRPSTTPDQPHWHGDDAVPLALRWHDGGWAEEQVVVEQQGAIVAGGVDQTIVAPPEPVRPPLKPSRKRSAAHHHRRANVCQPRPR